MFSVYCLESVAKPGRVYVGMTNNMPRRLRQHNGQLQGGARTTKGNRPWRVVYQIKGLTKRQAGQLEYALKHRRVRGYAGPEGFRRTYEKLTSSSLVE